MSDYDFDDYDDGMEDPPCPKCDGHRTISCYCGGDFCICQNYGERDCTLCHGEGVAAPERAEKYLQSQREMAEVMRKFWEKDKASSDTSGDRSE